jgi:hypothetical protein
MNKLVMVADDSRVNCSHPRLICGLYEASDSRTQPLITCVSCCAQWTPETDHASLP